LDLGMLQTPEKYWTLHFHQGNTQNLRNLTPNLTSSISGLREEDKLKLNKHLVANVCNNDGSMCCWSWHGVRCWWGNETLPTLPSTTVRLWQWSCANCTGPNFSTDAPIQAWIWTSTSLWRQGHPKENWKHVKTLEECAHCTVELSQWLARQAC